ncbi:MAG: amidase [Archangiaceae bacterium]|nr:amidase [Archangiaceae bacterium]
MFPTVAECTARIRERDRTLHAFACTRLGDAERDAAGLAKAAPRSRLHGVPYSLKDEWETVCLPTSGGSWRHRERRSTEDATVHTALQAAGAVLLGKTNMSDMGIMPEAINHLHGATLNPLNLERTAGGSSGGSAAAVADGMVGFDWGADIGGSIRLPASFCGVYGFKLSSECWPASHSFPPPPPSMAPLLAHGPLTKTLPQMRAVLETLAPTMMRDTGRSGFRARSVAIHVPGGKTPWGDFASQTSTRLARAVGGPVRVMEHGLPTIRSMQWTFNAVWASHFEDLLQCDPTLSLAQGLLAAVLGLGTLGRFDKRLHPTSAALMLQIAAGRYLVFRDKAAALAKARAVKDAFERVWGEGAVVAMPVSCYPPPRAGRTLFNMRVIECCVAGNLADAAALAIPFGHFPDGMPRALQLMGPPGSELHLLEVAERLTAA